MFYDELRYLSTPREQLREDLIRTENNLAAARQSVRERQHTVDVLNHRLNCIRRAAGSLTLDEFNALPTDLKNTLWSMIQKRA